MPSALTAQKGNWRVVENLRETEDAWQYSQKLALATQVRVKLRAGGKKGRLAKKNLLMFAIRQSPEISLRAQRLRLRTVYLANFVQFCLRFLYQ